MSCGHPTSGIAGTMSCWPRPKLVRLGFHGSRPRGKTITTFHMISIQRLLIVARITDPSTWVVGATLYGSLPAQADDNRIPRCLPTLVLAGVPEAVPLSDRHSGHGCPKIRTARAPEVACCACLTVSIWWSPWPAPDPDDLLSEIPGEVVPARGGDSAPERCREGRAGRAPRRTHRAMSPQHTLIPPIYWPPSCGRASSVPVACTRRDGWPARWPTSRATSRWGTRTWPMPSRCAPDEPRWCRERGPSAGLARGGLRRRPGLVAVDLPSEAWFLAALGPGCAVARIWRLHEERVAAKRAPSPD